MAAPIVLVHDDAEIRELALAFLREAGHEVAALSDPMRALDLIEAGSRPPVLVTLADFGEGKLNGVALARMIKRIHPVIGVIFIARPEDHQYAEGLGTLLSAPLDPRSLVEAVTDLLSASTQSAAC